MNKIQAIRGMRDVLPDETPMWQWLERKLHHMAFRYGYQEMRLPLLEPVTLFERAVGEATDIVSKEMYDFTDKSGEHITLRPEGTSGCMRAVLENNMCYNKSQRLWYQGPMFRYERPQRPLAPVYTIWHRSIRHVRRRRGCRTHFYGSGSL